MPSVNAYRVLIVDDEKDMCDLARNQILAIADPEDIHVDVAYTGSFAVDCVRKTLYDLILLDLYRGRVLMGLEVFRRLNEMGCSAEVILMTRFDLEPAASKPLMRAIAAQGDLRLVAFLDKRESDNSIGEEVRKCYRRFRASQFAIDNLDLAGQLIDRRRKRYERKGLFPLRRAVEEVDAEVERLLRVLYVEVPQPSAANVSGQSVSIPERSTDVTVTLEPIERRGISPAVVINATATVSLKGVNSVPEGHKTVLKIGPKPDVLEEASRYREFVRYGVKLNQRVELFGSASRDCLGALVYSFAGGLHGKRVVSLDDLLIANMVTGDIGQSNVVLQDLFSSRNWYAVAAPDQEVDVYFRKNYHADLLLSCQTAESELRGLADEFDDHIDFRPVAQSGKDEAFFSFSIDNSESLKLPTSSVLGLASMKRPSAACLVHGDMHAGNVMVEIVEAEFARGGLQREIKVEGVNLIDFRNSGPGPRTADAAALESSIRLADSEAACRQFAASGESGLNDRQRITLAAQMVTRAGDELALYQAIFRGVGEVPGPAWCKLAAEVLKGLQGCFADVSLEEYLRTSIRYALRQLGYKMQPVARVRILAWLAAQYQLLPQG